MKNVVVIYSGDDWCKDVPFEESKKDFKAGFEDFYVRGEKKGLKFYRASIDWFVLEKGLFKKGWAFENNKWIKISNEIKADVIFDKTMGKNNYKDFDLKMEIFKRVPITNNPLFRMILDNKLTQYMLFSEFMPKTFIANNKNELVDYLEKIKTFKMVVKPINGSGGFDIFIGEKKDFLANEKINYPVFVQEFLESTKGIPGFSEKEGVSDLRLIYTDHKLVYALSRVAKKNSLFTNFHQGSSVVLVPDEKIPESVEVMANKIQDRFLLFKNASYSLDFMFDNSGNPFLIEINTVPGLVFLELLKNDDLKERNSDLFAESVNNVC